MMNKISQNQINNIDIHSAEYLKGTKYNIPVFPNNYNKVISHEGGGLF